MRTRVLNTFGSAGWPGLPAANFCGFLLARAPNGDIAEPIIECCHAVDLDPAPVPAMCDVHHLFVRAELDGAYATEPHLKRAPFAAGDVLPSEKLLLACGGHLPQ